MQEKSNHIMSLSEKMQQIASYNVKEVKLLKNDIESVKTTVSNNDKEVNFDIYNSNSQSGSQNKQNIMLSNNDEFSHKNKKSFKEPNPFNEYYNNINIIKIKKHKQVQSTVILLNESNKRESHPPLEVNKEMESELYDKKLEIIDFKDESHSMNNQGFISQFNSNHSNFLNINNVNNSAFAHKKVSIKQDINLDNYLEGVDRAPNNRGSRVSNKNLTANFSIREIIDSDKEDEEIIEQLGFKKFPSELNHKSSFSQIKCTELEMVKAISKVKFLLRTCFLN